MYVEGGEGERLWVPETVLQKNGSGSLKGSPTDSSSSTANMITLSETPEALHCVEASLKKLGGKGLSAEKKPTRAKSQKKSSNPTLEKLLAARRKGGADTNKKVIKTSMKKK